MFEYLADGQVGSRPARALIPEDVAVISVRVRRRVLRWFARNGLAWDKGGFSGNASARIADDDRTGL